MGILSQVRQVIGMGEQREYTYLCRVCDRTFESTETHMARVDCPECGGHDVRAVARSTH